MPSRAADGPLARSIAIIGAGPGGLAMAIKLKEAGYDRFTLFEQADGVGGTWRHNAYPGCRCDVPSSLYSYSFAIKADWSEKFAPQPEILRYLEEVARDFGILPHARFNTELLAARWIAEAAQWELDFSDGAQLRFDIVVGAVGMFNVPAWSDIAGLRSFAGPVVHSARWDPGLDLAGKRVSVIGAAASAVQIVPAIAPDAAHLDVFQRTPNHVRPRAEYSEVDLTELVGNREAMLRDRQLNFDWIDAIASLTEPELIREGNEACAGNLALVADPALRERMRPDYPFGSKRPLISSDWYPTFNRANVALVTEPIARIEPDAVVTTDGRRHPSDVIVLATGFETGRFFAAVPVTGEGGQALGKVWQDGARAFKGITVPGFPNLFMMYGPNTNNGSIIFNLEVQADYVVRHLRQMDSRGLRWIAPREEAFAAYNAALQADIARVVPWQNATSNYYRAASGLNVTQYPHGMKTYAAMMSLPDFADYRGDAGAAA